MRKESDKKQVIKDEAAAEKRHQASTAVSDKDKTDEQKQDDKLQKEAQEKSAARAKLVDDIVVLLRKEFDKNLDQGGLQSVITEVQHKIAGMQVVAAGAHYGPTPEEQTKLEQELPVVAEPLQDGTPAANIGQATADQEGDKKKATSK